MEINRTQSLFQSLENIKLTTIFQPPSMLRYRPYFNVDSTLCACCEYYCFYIKNI